MSMPLASLSYTDTPMISARQNALRRRCTPIFAALAALLLSTPALALSPPGTVAKQAYLVDLTSAEVLLDKNGATRMAPSSMTKMMTAYLTYDALVHRRATMDTSFTISQTAWKMGGSRMFLKLPSQVRAEDLLRGLLIDSGIQKLGNWLS